MAISSGYRIIEASWGERILNFRIWDSIEASKEYDIEIRSEKEVSYLIDSLEQAKRQTWPTKEPIVNQPG